MKKNTILQLVAGIFLFGTTACTSNFEDYNKIPMNPIRRIWVLTCIW